MSPSGGSTGSDMRGRGSRSRPRPLPAETRRPLLVGGEPVVENGELKTADEQEITRELANATKALASEAEEKLKR